MTFTDVAAMVRPVLVIPVGAWEQHGPHLPFDTDTRIAIELCRRLVESHTNLILGPPITISASGEHAQFAGTLSIGTETTTQTIIELVRSATWAFRVVIVNGHGGNADAIDNARKILDDEQRRILFWSPPSSDNIDTHAGHIETSVLLAISPQVVQMNKVALGVTRPLSEIIDLMRTAGVRAVTDNGILGDPRHANSSDGNIILQQWTDQLISVFDDWVS